MTVTVTTSAADSMANLCGSCRVHLRGLFGNITTTSTLIRVSSVTSDPIISSHMKASLWSAKKATGSNSSRCVLCSLPSCVISCCLTRSFTACLGECQLYSLSTWCPPLYSACSSYCCVYSSTSNSSAYVGMTTSLHHMDSPSIGW